MGDLFQVSSHLLYVPAFTAMKNFYYAWSWKITQQYKFAQKLLNPQVSHLVPQRLQLEHVTSNHLK